MASAASTLKAMINKADPNAYYHVKLRAVAHHGRDLMRPRDHHVVLGAELISINPQDAIEFIERV